MRRDASIVLIVWALGGCAIHRDAVPAADRGIAPCPASAAARLLSTDALQCWFGAPGGRWRTLSHESHFAVLVVHVEAADIGDAEAIARRFVDGEQSTFTEILIYVRREFREGGVIRRVRWTAPRGFETLDFDSPDSRDQHLQGN